MFKNIFKKSPILSFFLPILVPYKWRYFVMLLAPISSGFDSIVYFYCGKLLIDALVAGNFAFEALVFPITLFCLFPIFANIMWRIHQLVFSVTVPVVRQEITNRAYNIVMNHSYKFFQDKPTGTIVSKIKGIADGYDYIWSNLIGGMIMFGVQFILSVIAIFSVHNFFGYVLIVWIIIFSAVFFRLVKKMNKLKKKESDSKHLVSGFISDKITNVFSIFSFGRKKYEIRHLNKYIKNDYIPKQRASEFYSCVFEFVQSSFYIIMLISFIFSLIYYSKTHNLTPGEIAFAFGVIQSTCIAVWVFLSNAKFLMIDIAELRSSMEIIKFRTKDEDITVTKKLKIEHPSIEFKDVCFDYDNKKQIVFNKLNLKIKPGENVGLVGYSGAGKSSLVSILLRYFEIKSGKILIDGQDTRLVSKQSLRENLGLIPQDSMLFNRTLMENIRYGRLNATDKEVIQAAKKAYIHDFIESLPEKYETEVGERGVKLSGGQRQRIAIARAILKNAPILILDEATSSLDSSTEKLIQKSLNHVLEEKNQTVIAIAHRLSTLKHMDRIIVLHKGKIIEEGTHSELIKKEDGLYKKLWNEQLI